MKMLRDVLQQAQTRGVAIGHFNISDLVLLKAVFDGARELNLPVLVGASEGERAFMGVRQIAALVKSVRDEFDFPIFLNADHTHSLASAEEAARAGFDAIVFDRSALPWEENVRQTREAVVALKAINPSILIEGEIGDIGTGSEIHETVPNLSKGLTSPAEARQFVEATGVDILAPAVGNMHGMISTMVQGEVKKHPWILKELLQSRKPQECPSPCTVVLEPTMTISAEPSLREPTSFTSTQNCELRGDVVGKALWRGTATKLFHTRFCRSWSNR
jgi:fructose-bisphosphate aldolase, class II